MRGGTAILGTVALVLLGAVVAGWTCEHALGAPAAGADPALAPWFQGLTTENGGGGCDVADCRPVDSRITGRGFEAYYDGTWIVIPPEKVRPQKTNPVGRAVLCMYQGEVRCFVPPLEV